MNDDFFFLFIYIKITYSSSIIYICAYIHLSIYTHTHKYIYSHIHYIPYRHSSSFHTSSYTDKVYISRTNVIYAYT